MQIKHVYRDFPIHCGQHGVRIACAHAFIKAGGARLGLDLQELRPGEARLLHGVLEQGPSYTRADPRWKYPQIVQQALAIAVNKRIPADQIPIRKGDIGCAFLERGRSDAQRGTPARYPLGRIAPVGFGGNTDFRQLIGLGGISRLNIHPDRDTQGRDGLAGRLYRTSKITSTSTA
jgi:hypothetical protein